jgi:1-acyl-sn-glycerol-3-phosphate acyltransferase
MLYQSVRLIIGFFLKMYFRRIKFSGMELIDETKPTLLCGNHTNAFLEGILIATQYPNHKLYFLARADVFNHPLAAKILDKLHIIPIYRIRDGYNALDRNKDTFNKVTQLLKEGKHVIIFSEGDCVAEKRLRTLKKGSARLAFQAVEEGVEDLQILPVGINYSDFGKEGEDALIQFSEPFNAKELYPQSESEKALSLNRFNEKLVEGLKKVVIDYPIQDYHKINQYTQQKRIAAILEHRNNNGKDPGIAEERQWVSDYHEGLPLAPLKKQGFFERLKIFESNLLTPLFFIPHFLSHRLTKKVVKSLDFFQSMEVAFRMVMVILWSLIFTTILTILVGGKLGVWIVVLIFYFLLYRFHCNNRPIQ